MISKKISLLSFFLVSFFLLFPEMGTILIVANLAICLAVLLLHLYAAALPRMRLEPSDDQSQNEPFVSVHVAAYNEPPSLLKKTLCALSRVSYSNYEVIVIDNNTADKEVWEPVQKYCKELGAKFRFYHVENLAGYKAGALNYIRPKIDPRTELIAVVDADYAVRSEFLHIAASYFTDPDVALVQFPQAYENINHANKGVAAEYEQFFSTYMNMANHCNCVPSTGTLSLFRLSALKQIGGFSVDCVTEDAEIGFRLNSAGYKGLYVPRVVGTGLMPYDLEAYKRQLKRWSFGNAQILRRNLISILSNPLFGWKQKLGIISQLTVWSNFTLIALIALLSASLGPVLFPENAAWFHVQFLLASVTVGFHFFFQFATFALSGIKSLFNPKDSFKAFLVHQGLGWMFATVWLECLISPAFAFERTNKFILPSMPSALKNSLPELTVFAVMLAAALLQARAGNLFQAIIAIAAGASFLLIFYINRQMVATKGHSGAIMARVEQQFN